MRHLTPVPRTPDDWPVADYSHTAEEFLEGLSDTIADALQERTGSEVEYSQGVLTVRLGEGETLVLNTQTPNRQIWFSSPVSGPSRYFLDTETGNWICTRDNQQLCKRLRHDLRALTGIEVNV